MHENQQQKDKSNGADAEANSRNPVLGNGNITGNS